MEAGYHPSASKIKIEVPDIMTLKIRESYLDKLGRDIQTQLVPSTKSMSKKIWQLEISQFRSLDYVNTTISTIISQGNIGLRGFDNCTKIEMDNFAGNINPNKFV